MLLDLATLSLALAFVLVLIRMDILSGRVKQLEKQILILMPKSPSSPTLSGALRFRIR